MPLLLSDIDKILMFIKHKGVKTKDILIQLKSLIEPKGGEEKSKFLYLLLLWKELSSGPNELLEKDIEKTLTSITCQELSLPDVRVFKGDTAVSWLCRRVNLQLEVVDRIGEKTKLAKEFKSQFMKLFPRKSNYLMIPELDRGLKQNLGWLIRTFFKTAKIGKRQRDPILP